MVHVAMGDEDIADPHELAGRQRRHIAEVEEERLPIKHQFHEEAWIPERVVHEMGIESWRHGDCGWSCRSGCADGTLRPFAGSRSLASVRKRSGAKAKPSSIVPLNERAHLGQNLRPPDAAVKEREMPAARHDPSAPGVCRHRRAQVMGTSGLARRGDVVVLPLHGHQRRGSDGAK